MYGLDYPVPPPPHPTLTKGKSGKNDQRPLNLFNSSLCFGAECSYNHTFSCMF